MKPFAVLPRDVLQNKPPHGSPCNRCGACCMATLCPLGQYVFQRPELPGPCPGLTKVESEYVCGLVLNPRKYAPTRVALYGVEMMRQAALHLIGSGDGCDARFNGESRDDAFGDALDADCMTPRRVAMSLLAKRIWGAK